MLFTKPRFRCSHENHLGVSTNNYNDAKIDGNTLKKTVSYRISEFMLISSGKDIAVSVDFHLR